MMNARDWASKLRSEADSLPSHLQLWDFRGQVIFPCYAEGGGKPCALLAYLQDATGKLFPFNVEKSTMADALVAFESEGRFSGGILREAHDQ